MKLQLRLDIIGVVTIVGDDDKEYMLVSQDKEYSYLHDPVTNKLGHCLTKLTKTVDVSNR